MHSYEKLAELDKSLVWHPFTQMKDWARDEITIIESGADCFLQDVKGRKFIDGVSSLWCNVHGHRRKEIDDAIRDQLGRIAHSTFLGLSNVPAILLAEKLIKIVPPGLRRVFYSDSGSEAVEIALKMAYQYWAQKGSPKKRKFLKLENAYHGDTIGAVSVGGIPLFHEVYKPLLFETFSAPSPYCYRWPSGSDPGKVCHEALEEMEKVLRENADEIAAVVMEPMMQGAAGMIDQPAGFVRGVSELSKKYNVLLIFDEVATGFGRTGRMFASEHEAVTPDILAVAKGITGGYLPLAATITTEKVYEAFLGEYAGLKTFFHGHTYTANPLACRAAIANLEIFEREKTLGKLAPKIALTAALLEGIAELDHVGDVRQAGLMVGIELVKDKKTKEPYPFGERMGYRVTEKAREKEIWIRPLGNVIVLMPPLAIPESLLERLVGRTGDSIRGSTESAKGRK